MPGTRPAQAFPPVPNGLDEQDRLEPDPSGSEVPHTLGEPAPRTLGVLDQLGLWGNLGVSLLGFSGAIVVLQPLGPGSARLSLLAALSATVVGTVLGVAAVAVAAVPGA